MEINYRRGLAHRLLSAAFRVPEPMVQRLLGDPVEVDGRVLNRSVQLMLAATEKVDPSGLDSGTPEQRRTEMARTAPLAMPVATDMHVTERLVPGPAGRLRLRVYRPHGLGPRPPAIVFFHGGGWVVGDLDTHDGSCRILAAASRCVVISVDYRLAPEHPFPAAPEDCLAAYSWVVGNPEELDVDPLAVAVSGDSAGGNLAAVVCRQALGVDVVPPVAQGLIYPAVDFRLQTRSVELFSEGFFLTRESMDWFRNHYIPDGVDPLQPDASPALCENVSGVAPAIVWTAGFDPLRDEGRAYADLLAKSGVDVRHVCVDDMVHGFFNLGIIPGVVPLIEDMAKDFGTLIRDAARARTP